MTANAWQARSFSCAPMALLLGWGWLAGICEARDAVDGGPPAAKALPARLHVEIDRGSVTVRAWDVATEDLLAAIALESGLEVDLGGPLAERVTLELDQLPLREALHRILSGRNFALRYADPPPPAGEAPAGKLWVLSGGDRRSLPAQGDAGGLPDAGADLLAAYERLARRRPSLVSDDGKVRLAAVSGLTDSPRATAALAAAALFDPDAAVREEAVYGLGAGGETGEGILEQALADPAPRVRRAAIEALADVGDDDSAWLLAAALRDRDAALREQAVYALGDVGGEAAVAVLQQALADGQSRVREAAIEVLEELSDAD